MNALFKNKIVMGVLIVLVLCGVWYYFIDTLTISQVIGDDVSSNDSIFVNMFDFDTELSRYNLNKLKYKVPKWDKRLQEIDANSDSTTRDREREKVMREILSDSSVKKLMRHIPGFGRDTIGTIFDIIN